MVFYFVTKELVPGSLLQRFVDGDDEFRTSRLKLIPSVPKVLISVSLYMKKRICTSQIQGDCSRPSLLAHEFYRNMNYNVDNF